MFAHTHNDHKKDPNVAKISFYDEKTDETIVVTAYRSTQDGAWVVELDTSFEPNKSKIRIWLNDEQVYNTPGGSMSPTTALLDLLDAFEREDRETIIDSLDSLSDWVERGGFLPKVVRVERFIAHNEDSTTYKIRRS